MNLQKVVFINGSIGNNANSFTQEINVEFQPSEVKLLYVVRQDNDAHVADPVTILRSSLIDNNILITFPDTGTYYEKFEIPFPLNKSINGLYTFEILTINGNRPLNIATYDTTISLCLLFTGNKKINHLS